MAEQNSTSDDKVNVPTAIAPSVKSGSIDGGISSSDRSKEASEKQKSNEQEASSSNSSPSSSSAKTVLRRLIIVGAGSSSSTPKIECLLHGSTHCFCQEAYMNPKSKNNRLNPCAVLQFSYATDDHNKDELHNILIDCGKTFREAALKVLVPNKIAKFDAVLLSHYHSDAILGGVDDLREFASNYSTAVSDQAPSKKKKKDPPLPIYADAETMEALRRIYPYLFQKGKRWVAAVEGIEFKHNDCIETSFAMSIQTLAVDHGEDCLCNGFAFQSRLGPVVYISDVSKIPPKVMNYLQSISPIHTLVLDLLSHQGYFSHFNFDQAMKATKDIGALNTYYVGMSHSVDYDTYNKEIAKALPGIHAELAYDGQAIFEDMKE